MNTNHWIETAKKLKEAQKISAMKAKASSKPSFEERIQAIIDKKAK